MILGSELRRCVARSVVGLLHGLGAAVAVVVGVDWSAGVGDTVDVVCAHLDAGEAVVLAVDGREEIDDEAEHIEDVDESNDPFEDGGSVSVAPITSNAKA